ncbi:integral membrane protein Pth11-like protein [Penicillium herquei]|nr:integral membrane protein Pth11-like protein [Penicillium herquei]
MTNITDIFGPAPSDINLAGNKTPSDNAGTHGLGKHVWVSTVGDVVDMRKILFTYIWIYIALMVVIKCSILMFYRKVLCMKKSVWILMGLCFGWAIGCGVSMAAACQPLSYFWTMYNNGEGKCIINLYGFYLGNAAANVFTDICILSAPLPVIWKLQMRKAQKVMVTAIFLLGSFVCVASIMRIYYMSFLNTDVDVNWIMGDVFVWSTVEPAIGIVCACLPTLQPLLRWSLKNVVGSSMGRYFGGSDSRNGYKGYSLEERRRTFEGSANGHFRHISASDYGVRGKGSESITDDLSPIITSAQVNAYAFRGERDIEDSHDPGFISVDREIHWREDHDV